MSLSSELHYLEIGELATLIQSRKVSPVEVTQAMIAEAEARRSR